MPHTTIVKLGAALTSALAIAIPTATAAADPSPGGLGFADPSAPTVVTDPSAPTVFADGSTLAAPPAQMLGELVRFQGTLAGAQPGDGVVLQRQDPVAGWVTAATATAGADGAFEATWRPDRPGRTTLRIVPGAQASAASTDATPAPGRELTVYRPATATWYGPGFYGRRTACGRRLTRGLLGVAHRTLPCGTLVALYKDGRTLTVPVVDRGPFRRGTSYDLTAATAQALGMTVTTRIGAVRAAPVAAPSAP